MKSNLSGDIETNPGPVINSVKTIQAPFSQDNVANYFQGRYQNPHVLFELKGVHINEEQCDMAHF